MVLAGALERRWLFPLRSAQWKGRLSAEQYIGRNQRIFAHPYAQGIRTYLKKENGALCASFDALPLPFLFRNPLGELQQTEGVHVASVLTAPENRGKGYAKSLLADYFSAHPSEVAFLNSGIGTKYYRDLGFSANSHPGITREVETQQLETLSMVAISLRADEFVKRLRDERVKRLVKAEGSFAVTLYPNELLLDWHLERYRYFADIMGRTLPQELFWEVNDTFLAAVPDFAQQQLDCFWCPIADDVISSFLHGLARRFGLKRVRYVERGTPLDETAQDIPMLRFPPGESFQIVDYQLGDNW